MTENMKNGKEQKLTVFHRKADFRTIIREFSTNFIIVYSIYGMLFGWNPQQWDIAAQAGAVFFLCIYYPYKDAKRALRKEKENETSNINK